MRAFTNRVPVYLLMTMILLMMTACGGASETPAETTAPVATAVPAEESVAEPQDPQPAVEMPMYEVTSESTATYIVQEEFLAGCREYFRRHAWGNAELVDFLGALEESSGRDLSAWRAPFGVVSQLPSCGPCSMTSFPPIHTRDSPQPLGPNSAFKSPVVTV